MRKIIESTLASLDGVIEDPARVILGRGKLLFREGENARLRLIDATSLPTGIVVLRYEPAH